jgi:hypothetical protein
MSYGRFILVAIPPTAYDIVRLDGSLVIEAGESLLHYVEFVLTLPCKLVYCQGRIKKTATKAIKP